MVDIIDLLEKLGSEAKPPESGSNQLARRLTAAGVSPAVRTAIISADRGELSRLIGASENVCCIVDPAMDDEEDEEVRRQQECEEEGADGAVPIREPAKVASAAK